MSTVPEVLFTASQLVQITTAAAEYLLRYSAEVVSMGLASTSIQRVSTSSGLILVQGSEHTGMRHIQVRHHPASLRRTWQADTMPNGETKLRLDDPSRFRPGLVPIFDYITIADTIYLQGRLDEEGNRRSDEFEKYIGIHIYADGVAVDHTLLVYKGTKVIHTLFPKESFPRKKRIKGFLLRRGQASASWNLATGVTKTTIPYLCREGIIRYAIVIYLNSILKLYEFELVKYDALEQPEKYMLMGNQSYEGHVAPDPAAEMLKWQHADLTAYERIIGDNEKQLIV